MPEPPAELYHFSEEPGLRRFEPRLLPTHPEPVVWAIEPRMAHLYYFPRECPRVTFYASNLTSDADRERFFGTMTATKVAAMEASWLAAMRKTKLYRYVFPGDVFSLQDENAGQWVSREAVDALLVEPVGDLLEAHANAGVELRMMPSLWPLYEAVIASTLGFSIIRWRNASPRVGERTRA